MKHILGINAHPPITTPPPVTVAIAIADGGGPTDYQYTIEVKIHGYERGQSGAVPAQDAADAKTKVFERAIEYLARTLAEAVTNPSGFAPGRGPQ